MFKESQWKPALALLIARNAASKTPVLKSMESRSHKACELFVLLVLPGFLSSTSRRSAKLADPKGGENPSGKRLFELQSPAPAFQPHRRRSRHDTLDVRVIKHVCTGPHAHVTVRSHRMLLLSLLLVSISTDTKTTAAEIVFGCCLARKCKTE